MLRGVWEGLRHNTRCPLAHTPSTSPTSLMLLFYTNRFMQLAPQYYFSNLPPSESKDILQQVMGHLAPISTMKKEGEKCRESTEQRCAVQ